MLLTDLAFLITFPTFCPTTGVAVPVIFCTSCGTAITGGGSGAANSPISYHITEKHGPCSLKHLDALIYTTASPSLRAALDYWAAQPQFTSLPPRLEDSEPLPLLPVLQGYECQICQARRLNYKSVQRHVRQEHAVQNKAKAHWGELICLISMQTWFPTHPCGRGVWWRVRVVQSKPEPEPEPEPELIHKTSSLSNFIHNEILTEGTQLQDNINPYIERTGWMHSFQGQADWYAIKQLSSQPKQHKKKHQAKGDIYTHQPLYIDAGCTFNKRHESILAAVLAVFKQSFARCESTFRFTLQPLLGWVNSSYKNRIYRRPFKWLRVKESLTTYLNTWLRLICYVYRGFGYYTRTRLAEAFFTKYLPSMDTYDKMREVWVVVHDTLKGDTDKYKEDLAEINNSLTLPTTLVEMCFDISMQFVMQELRQWERTSESILLHFAGVISIIPKDRGFCPTSQSTSKISALIWVSRLLLLEYALPKHSYILLNLPSRDSYPDIVARLKNTWAEHGVQDATCPLGELCSIRDYGRKVRHLDSARCFLFWTPDLQTVRIGKQSISMPAFRTWVKCAIQTAASQLAELLFFQVQPLLPALDSLVDEYTKRTPGYSFISEPQNQLGAPALEFIQAAAAKLQHPKTEKWRIASCKAYLKKQTAFLQSLLLVMHQTGGQPGRGPEILTAKVCNTASSTREIYVFHGLLLTLIKYNKARASTNEAFYVARFLPDAVGQLLYHYLVLVRPLARKIEQDLELASSSHPHYLWPLRKYNCTPLIVKTASCNKDAKERVDFKERTVKEEEEQSDSETELGSEAESEPDSGPDSESESDSESDSESGAEPGSKNGKKEEDQQESKLEITNQQHLSPTSPWLHRGSWKVDALTRVLKLSSKENKLNFIFTTSSYRQIVSGIGKTHLLEEVKPFNLTPSSSTTDARINLARQGLAWQAGHTLHEDLHTYGLNGVYPTDLQPQLLLMYLRISKAWHDWLDLPSYDDTCQALREEGTQLMKKRRPARVQAPATTQAVLPTPPPSSPDAAARIGATEKRKLPPLASSPPTIKRRRQ